ncbi:MAG: 6-hydroxycyclohex-1-ene-1-carbonyl-CoA dehydrogenase [Acidobacteriota bacterium]
MGPAGAEGHPCRGGPRDRAGSLTRPSSRSPAAACATRTSPSSTDRWRRAADGPLVPGHEVSGTVVWADGRWESLVGRQVVVPAVWPCNDCALCRGGRPNACTRQRMPGNDVRGGFASHVAAPAWCLAPLSGTLPEPELVELAVVADAVATPYEAAHRVALSQGELAVVVGAGGVGGFLVQIAAAFGASVIALDVDPERLALAAAHGALATLDVKGLAERDVRARVRDLADELRVPKAGWKIFETSGTPPGQRIAFELLNPAATLCVVGYCRDRIELRLSTLMAFDAQAVGIWGCRPQLYPQAIDLVRQGKVKIGPYVERRALADVNQVVAEAHSGKLRRRAILVPGGSTAGTASTEAP